MAGASRSPPRLGSTTDGMPAPSASVLGLMLTVTLLPEPLITISSAGTGSKTPARAGVFEPVRRDGEKEEEEGGHE